MAINRQRRQRYSGVANLTAGARSPFCAALASALLSVGLVGCGSSPDTKTLHAVQLAMMSSQTPFYSDGEITLYQSKMPVSLPMLKPSDEELQTLRMNKVVPYTRTPWFTADDVQVQVTWTLSNLDPDPHNIEILVDPWNEFVRYWPGINQISDNETLPDLSGIDLILRVEGRSRVNGVFTFDDMKELATDLATATNLIDNPPASSMMDGGIGVNTLVNHAFEVHNRYPDDKLTRPYVPAMIDGLTGFDLGLRTGEAGNVEIEIVAELVDHLGTRVNGNADVTTDGSGQPRRTLTAPPAATKGP